MGKSHEVPQLLYHMTHNERMTQREIGDELGCSARTVGRKLEKYDIDPHSCSGPSAPRASYKNSSRGYVQSQCNDCNSSIYIHQLSAILSCGDPFLVFDENTEVHHKNEIKWDNRPSNLEVLYKGEHSSRHLLDGHNWSGVSL